MSHPTDDRARHEEPLENPIVSRRPFRCGVCGAEFMSREQLEDHERQEHKTP